MISRIKKNHTIIILISIILYCTYLLLYKLGLQSFRIDEGFSSYVSKYMTINGLYKCSYFLFGWLQVLFFKIGGFNDYRARIPSIIAQIGSIFLMYFIPYKLCKNKYVGLASALIFGLLYRELGRGRDARFYSLLQLFFLGGITLIIEWIETKKTAYLNSVIILTGLGIIFHPFLYIIGAILLGTIIRQYKKIRDFNSIFSKKFLSTWILIIIGGILAIIYGTLGGVLNGSLTNGLKFGMKKFYFLFYNSHLRTELGLIYVIGLLGMVHFFIKKSYRELILFFVPLVLFIYALVIKGYLMHSRYALLIFPLIILSASIFIFDLIKLIENRYAKLGFLSIIIVGTICTANFQFIPSAYYYFDYTSPQPDFKGAYESIPNGQSVISGFPTLCDWYYSDRGNCTSAIRVDLVHDGKTKVTNETNESYTKLPYINSLEDLDFGEHYFVIDNLTNKSYSINKELYDQIFKYGKKIYESGKENYNNIVVLKVLIK